jgi:hypothetical protein
MAGLLITSIGSGRLITAGGTASIDHRHGDAGGGPVPLLELSTTDDARAVAGMFLVGRAWFIMQVLVLAVQNPSTTNCWAWPPQARR